MTDNQIFSLFSIFYFCVGAGILIRPGYYRRFIESFSSEPFGVFLSGMVAIVIGYFLIIHYNIWEFSKIVIITIIGWLIFLKGILILAIPETFTGFSARLIKKKGSMKFCGIVTLIIGLIFLTLSLL